MRENFWGEGNLNADRWCEEEWFGKYEGIMRVGGIKLECASEVEEGRK